MTSNRTARDISIRRYNYSEVPMTNEKILHVTNKELFYAAVMLGVQQLVNVLYDYPASEAQ